MENYRVNLVGFGVDDDLIDSLFSTIPCLEVSRKGEVWNKRTGKLYKENIIRLSITTTYEEGFQSAVDRIIKKAESISLFEMFSMGCSYIELQIWIQLDDNLRVPSISLTPEQMGYLARINAHLDVDIN